MKPLLTAAIVSLVITTGLLAQRGKASAPPLPPCIPEKGIERGLQLVVRPIKIKRNYPPGWTNSASGFAFIIQCWIVNIWLYERTYF